MDKLKRLIPQLAPVPVAFLVSLLLLAGLILFVMGATGCDDGVAFYSSPDSHKKSIPAPAVKASMSGGPIYARPGTMAHRTLRALPNTTPAPDQVRLAWMPPHGATNLTFNPPPDPGGPPFVWDNQPPDQEISVSFEFGPLPAGQNQWYATDMLGVGTAGQDGEEDLAYFVTAVTNPGRTSPPDTPTRPRTAGKSSQTTRTVWEVNRWSWSTHVTVTTELCGEWAAFVQRPDVFAAVRLPMPAVAPTQAFSLPLVLSGDAAPAIYLNGPGWDDVVAQARLELRPERQDWAENLLPAAPGQHWLTLGAVQEPIPCPTGLSLPPDEWVIRTRLLLDMGAQPNDCGGCQMLTYYCYEGQDPPLSAATRAAAQALDPRARTTTYRGWGITCLGPIYTPLEDAAVKQWDLHGTSALYVSPTVTTTVAVRHVLRESVDGTLDVSLAYTSTLPAEWQLYDGTWDQPDLGTPLASLVTVDNSRLIWLVASTPLDTPSGLYGLSLTGSAAALPPKLHAADSIWVGAWVAPPLPPGAVHHVYLPLVVRQGGNR